MIEHEVQTRAEAAGPAAMTPTIPGPAIPLPLLQQIEDSLDCRFALGEDSAASETRRANRMAMREHLYAVISAYMELGSSAEEAIAAALRHAGEVRATAHTEVPARSARQPSALAATLLSIPLFGLPWLADNERWAASLWERWIGPFETDVMTKAASEAPFYRFELLAVPLIAGLIVGLIAWHRAARGVLYGLALLTIPALLFPGFVHGLGFAGFVFHAGDLPWLPDPVPAMVGLPYWAGLGGLGAYAGSLLRHVFAGTLARNWRRRRRS